MPSQDDATACHEAIFAAGVWELGDYTFANGTKANNKLFMERLFDHPKQLEVVVSTLGKIVMQHEPDILWGVPKGGQDFATALGRQLYLPVVSLEKIANRPGYKSYKFESSFEAMLLKDAICAVAIEDVTTEFTSLAGALSIPQLGEKTFGAVAIWRRGEPRNERNISIPTSWIIEEQLPNIITPEHPFYQKYGHLAVQQEQA